MTGAGLVCGIVVVGVAATLVVIGRTGWLESHTLRKCVLLSVLLHASLAVAFAALGGLRPASFGAADEGQITMLVVTSTLPGDGAATGDEDPDGSAAGSAVPAATTPADATDDVEPATGATDATGTTGPVDDQPGAAADRSLADRSPAADGPPDDLVPLLEVPAEPPAEPKPAGDVAAGDDVAMPADTAAVAADIPEDALTGDADRAATASGLASGPASPQAVAENVSPALPGAAAVFSRSGTRPHVVPETYADRGGGRRAGAALARGGSADTERAVQAALAWLAAAQSEDGRWSAARHGAGVERAVQGHHRSGAGLRGDHGVTGLALLAFLGAGNTHEEGPYAASVARGLAFLAARQRADGALAGDAEFFAVLYCHGMASIAVAEALAMTGDESLRPVLERAVRYTLAMQSPATGGWRYAAGDKGDTSQLGWQLMLLSSGRAAGLGGFDAAEAGARSFLQGVSSGRAGGLAAYRPGERPGMAMTAEALFCRMLLGMPADHPAAAEGIEFLARSPPDPHHPNAYAWYYATLASFHVGGPQWEAWNRQLQAALLPLQRRESGGLDGSWDPDPVWGGHGGRVYSTALAAMTLEVYYRHLPMHRRSTATAAAAGRIGR